MYRFSTALGSDRAGKGDITDIDGSVVARQYTARDQLSQIDYNTDMVATFGYDAGLRRTSRVLGDTPGTQTAWVYGRQDNLPTAINSGVAGASFTYTYDANKNKLTEGISTPMANFGFNSTAYDQADRLTAWNRTDGNLDQAWNLSLVGDWATFTENQVQQTRSHTAVHEIAAIDANPIAHDATGNLTRNAGDTLDRYTWDFDNRLATADVDQDGTAEIAYQYDARGRRVSKTVPDGEGSATTVFVYLGNQVVSEYTADALPTSPDRKFVYATYIDEPVVMIDRTAMGAVAAGTDELLFYHCNSLYSVAAITDASGTVVERCAYSAYGKPLIFDASMQLIAQSAIGNPYLFTGRRLDPESGLYYYRARMYDTELGRFVSRDPIGYEAGSMGLYEYCKNSPLIYTDSLGLDSVYVGLSFGKYLYKGVGGGLSLDLKSAEEDCCVDGIKSTRKVYDGRIHGEVGIGLGIDVRIATIKLAAKVVVASINVDVGLRRETECGGDEPCWRFCTDIGINLPAYFVPVYSGSAGVVFGIDVSAKASGSFRICYNFPGCPEEGLAIGFCGSVTIESSVSTPLGGIAGGTHDLMSGCEALLGTGEMLNF